MNSDIIRGQWLQLKGTIRERFNKLTDDDLGALEGHREYLVGKLQERYGIAKEHAEKQVESFEKSLR